MEHLGVEMGLINIPPEKYFLRGRRGKTLEELAAEAYLLPDEEKPFASAPDRLIAFAIHQALKKLEFPALEEDERPEMRRQIDSSTPDPLSMIHLDWFTIASQGYLNLGPKSVYLFTVGFWNLLAHFLSNQAMRLIEDSLGYHSIIGNWNAAVALPWFIEDFSDAEYYAPLDGFGNFVSKICRRIKKNGGVINTATQLTKVSALNGPQGYKWKLTFKDGKKNTYLCKKLVLALPRAALERLRVEKVKPWQELRKTQLSSVKPHNLFKILLVYETPWWKKTPNPGGDAGKVITDQPLRQIYYYGPKWINKHTSTAGRKTPSWPFIMASYCDEYYSEFWSTFFSTHWRLGEAYFEEPRNVNLDEPTKRRLIEIARQDGVHWRMVNKIHRQLSDLHELRPEEIPKPVVGVFMNRDWEPYSGGWHTWEVSVRSWLVTKRMIQPFADTYPDIYICGEAYSVEQGWIEGALNTAERVLFQKLNLPQPKWFAGDDFKHYLLRATARGATARAAGNVTAE